MTDFKERAQRYLQLDSLKASIEEAPQPVIFRVSLNERRLEEARVDGNYAQQMLHDSLKKWRERFLETITKEMDELESNRKRDIDD